MILDLYEKIKDFIYTNNANIIAKERRSDELSVIIDKMIESGVEWVGTLEDNERMSLDEELDDMYYLQERAKEALAIVDRINTTGDIVEIIDILTDHYSYKY